MGLNFFSECCNLIYTQLTNPTCNIMAVGLFNCVSNKNTSEIRRYLYVKRNSQNNTLILVGKLILANHFVKRTIWLVHRLILQLSLVLTQERIGPSLGF